MTLVKYFYGFWLVFIGQSQQLVTVYVKMYQKGRGKQTLLQRECNIWVEMFQTESIWDHAIINADATG